jgi:hypothetical protein
VGPLGRFGCPLLRFGSGAIARALQEQGRHHEGDGAEQLDVRAYPFHEENVAHFQATFSSIN